MGNKNTKKKTEQEDDLQEEDPATSQAKNKRSKQEDPEEVDKSAVPGSSEQDLGGDTPYDADGSNPRSGDNLGKKASNPVNKNSKNKTHSSDADDEVPDKNSMIKKEEKDIEVDVTEDVEALLNASGEEDLDEEYKEKVKSIFEAAVKTAVKEEQNKLVDEFEAKVEEQVEQRKDEIVEQLDSYLNYVVEEWTEENKVALEKGIKSEIVEQFMSGLKGLFEQHNIEMPDEKYDVLEEITEERNKLEQQLDEAVNKRSKVERELNQLKRKEIIREQTKDLTESQAEKIEKLCESLDIQEEDKFKRNVQLFVENYFPTDKGSEGEDEMLQEEQETEEPNESPQNSLIEQANKHLAKANRE